MDYTPRIMDAPGFVVAELTTWPLPSEQEVEWMEQAHNFRVGHRCRPNAALTFPRGSFLAVYAQPSPAIYTVLSLLPEDQG